MPDLACFAIYRNKAFKALFNNNLTENNSVMVGRYYSTGGSKRQKTDYNSLVYDKYLTICGGTG